MSASSKPEHRPGEAWTPPFCARAVELECPNCDDGGAVRVREHKAYSDGGTYDAYCADCHAELEVTAIVEITFADVEVVDV
jgi:hypothetical protein